MRRRSRRDVAAERDRSPLRRYLLTPLWFWDVYPRAPWWRPWLQEVWCAPLNWPRPLGFPEWEPDWYDRGRLIAGSRYARRRRGLARAQGRRYRLHQPPR